MYNMQQKLKQHYLCVLLMAPLRAIYGFIIGRFTVSKLRCILLFLTLFILVYVDMRWYPRSKKDEPIIAEGKGRIRMRQVIAGNQIAKERIRENVNDEPFDENGFRKGLLGNQELNTDLWESEDSSENYADLHQDEMSEEDGSREADYGDDVTNDVITDGDDGKNEPDMGKILEGPHTNLHTLPEVYNQKAVRVSSEVSSENDTDLDQDEISEEDGTREADYGDDVTNDVIDHSDDGKNKPDIGKIPDGPPTNLQTLPEVNIQRGTNPNYTNIIDMGKIPDGPLTPLHTLPEVYKQKGVSPNYTNILNVTPPKYLPNFRNPCWYEPLPLLTPPYRRDFYYQSYHSFYYSRAEALWLEHKNRGITWRLRCLPFYHIAGVAKAGTTDVHSKLVFHQQIAPSASKEIHWWAQHRIGAFTENTGYVPIHDYIDLYDLAAQQIHDNTVPGNNGRFHPMIVGDASASKLTFSGPWRSLPENKGHDSLEYHNGHYIRHITPSAHIIVMLREPAERLYSDYIYFGHYTTPSRFHYLMNKGIRSFNACLKKISAWQCVTNSSILPTFHGIQRSVYHIWVSRWLEIIPRGQLHPVRLEDYKKDKIMTLNNLVRKFGLDNFSKDAEKKVLYQTNVRNANRKGVHGPMLNSTAALLKHFFQPWNQKLADLLQDKRLLWED